MLKSTCVDFKGFGSVPRSQGGLLKENGFVFLIANPARFRGLQECLAGHHKDLEQCARETLIPAGEPDEAKSSHSSLESGDIHRALSQSGTSHSGSLRSGHGYVNGVPMFGDSSHSGLSDPGYHSDVNSGSVHSRPDADPLHTFFPGSSNPGSPRPDSPRAYMSPRVASPSTPVLLHIPNASPVSPNLPRSLDIANPISPNAQPATPNTSQSGLGSGMGNLGILRADSVQSGSSLGRRKVRMKRRGPRRADR